MRATDIARAMVAEYGMGETLGLSTYPRQRMPAFLESGTSMTGGREYSEVTAAKLDDEVKAILAKREEHVANLLTSNREKLVRVADTLLEKEVIFEDEFKALIVDDGLAV